MFKYRLVLLKKNIDELDDLYYLIKDLGIKDWRIIEVDPIGRAKGNDALLLDHDDMQRMLNFIFDARKRDPELKIKYGCGHFWGNDLDVALLGNFFSCFTGYWVASILSNGDIFGCPDIERRPELIEGNIRKDSFVDVWEHRFKKYRSINRTSNAKCKKCSDWKFCLGDAFHTWDFDENKPNFCVHEIFQKEYAKREKAIHDYELIKKSLQKKEKVSEPKKSSGRNSTKSKNKK